MWGVDLPYPFSKIKKNSLILGKKALIVLILKFTRNFHETFPALKNFWLRTCYYKSVHHPFLTRGNRENLSMCQNESVNSPFN